MTKKELFEEHEDNEQYFSKLDKTIRNLKSLKKPEWEEYDMNWYVANQVRKDDFTEQETLGYLQMLEEIGYLQSKPSTASTYERVYKVKAQYYSSPSLKSQFDKWKVKQTESLSPSTVETYIDSTVIKESTIQDSQLQIGSNNSKQKVSPKIPDQSKNEGSNFLELMKKFWYLVLLPIVIGILVLIFEYGVIPKMFSGE